MKKQTTWSRFMERYDPLRRQLPMDPVILFSIYTLVQKGVTREEWWTFRRHVPTLFPWDPGYNKWRLDFNQRYNVFPLMIVLAKRVRHIRLALYFAQRYDILCCMRSGGHSAEAYSICSGMVMDQSRRHTIRLVSSASHHCTCVACKEKRPYARSHVRIDVGAQLGQVALKLGQYGLALPAGTCPTVGVGGLTLGGGIGFLNRAYGLTSDMLIQVETVLADGRVVRANDRDHSDLFWASRGGGGGNFGVATTFWFCVPHIPCVIVFRFDFTVIRQFVRIMRAWQRFAPVTTDQLSSQLLLLPSDSGLMLTIVGQYVPLGHTALTTRQLQHKWRRILRATPTTTVRKVSYVEAVRFFSGGDKLQPPYFKNKNQYIQTELPSEALKIAIRFMQRAPPNSTWSLDAQGGVISHVSPRATAYAHRRQLLWALGTTNWSNPWDQDRHLTWIESFWKALQPFFSSAVYVNQIDSNVKDYMHAYYGVNARRLIRIKKRYDPGNFFRFPQSIPVTNLQSM